MIFSLETLGKLVYELLTTSDLQKFLSAVRKSAKQPVTGLCQP
jgi:hypothetical protein